MVKHSKDYRRPVQFGASHTLVVGSGLSCVQIANDLLENGQGNVSIACAKTDEEIYKQNGHIKSLADAPPLAKLYTQGVTNYGKLLEILPTGFKFEKYPCAIIPKERFDTVIYATGYGRDFRGLLTKLKARLRPGEEVYAGHGVDSAIPGLFFAGMPPSPAVYTAIISQGTADANKVYEKIMQQQ
jgi:hypothetical protein